MDLTGKISAKKILQSRFFSEAKATAFKLAKSPDKLRELVERAHKKAMDSKKESIGEVFDSLMICFRLLTSYTKGDYRDIPWKSLISIVGSVVYFVMPADLIPDFILTVGLLDDAALITWTVNSIRKDIEHFLDWERNQSMNSKAKPEDGKKPQRTHPSEVVENKS